MIDINNTQIAFESKTDSELKWTYRLFKMMQSPTLVSVGSKLTMFGLNLHLPIEWAIKRTIFAQFCGGTTLLESQKTIDHLAKYQTMSILDYGAEAKNTEADFDLTMREMIRVIEFASQNATVPIISCKVTGLGRFELLEKMDRNETLDANEKEEYARVLKRLDCICFRANELKVGVFIDAEETWIQDTVDFLCRLMMERYNKTKITVYNTFQMYRHDRLAFLKDSLEIAKREGYILGAKLVRGAYMEKERKRAAEMGYRDPIQPDKASSDRDYNAGVTLCVDNLQHVALCIASHNVDSSLLCVKLCEERGINPKNPHVLFSQLYGMSDNLTFNLAKAGYNVGKYVPYGPVRDVVPYLIRRAQENTSVSGDMGRELTFIKTEMKRRGL